MTRYRWLLENRPTAPTRVAPSTAVPSVTYRVPLGSSLWICATRPVKIACSTSTMLNPSSAISSAPWAVISYCRSLILSRIRSIHDRRMLADSPAVFRIEQSRRGGRATIGVCRYPRARPAGTADPTQVATSGATAGNAWRTESKAPQQRSPWSRRNFLTSGRIVAHSDRGDVLWPDKER